jgi:holliday junction DNA helicase RuvA
VATTGDLKRTTTIPEEEALIAQITGRLAQKEPTQIIIDVGGIGYELTIPVSTYYELAEPGTEVTLRVYTHVREDALQLFGFRTEAEKRLFLLLTSVSGIGPRLAITILSGMGTEDLLQAITKGDLPRLISVPGIGKKTAERLLVELKDKVQGLAMSQSLASSSRSSGTLPDSPTSLSDDLVSALTNLGYSGNIATKAATAAIAELPDGMFSQVLKLALRQLAK